MGDFRDNNLVHLMKEIPINSEKHFQELLKKFGGHDELLTRDSLGNPCRIEQSELGSLPVRVGHRFSTPERKTDISGNLIEGDY